MPKISDSAPEVSVRSARPTIIDRRLPALIPPARAAGRLRYLTAQTWDGGLR